MAGTGEIVEFSVAAMIEDVLLEHGKELCAVSQSKNDAKAKAATKRNEATRWIRKTVGVVAAKDLPSEPSEEDFRMGLRSGLVLCAALNKIERGAIPKMVGNPSDSVLVPDGEPLSESPYCENLTNFLEAVEQRGIPSFDIDDLEEWGRLPKVVNCILALNSYSNWKKSGGTGSFKFDGNPKPSPNRKQMVLKSLDMDKCDLWKDVKDKPLHMRIQDLLSDKKAEDIPVVIEIVLTKLIEEFERRLESHKEKIRQSKEKSEALARGRNEDVKSSPRDRHKEMEMKMKSKLKKEQNKDENASSKDSKAFSIIKEMQRKAAANDMSNEIEKKTPTQTPKKAAASDGNKETEKKISMFAKKFADNINNEMQKKPTTDTTGNKETEKKPTTDPKKSIADVFKKVENKPTTEAKKSTGDVSNQKPTTEAKKSTTDVNKQTEKKPPAETKKSISETEKKPTTEAKKSASDVKKPTTEAKKSVSDVNKVIEKKETTEAKKSISDVNKAIEKKETTEAKKSSDVNNQIEKKAAPTETKKAVSDVNIQTEKKAATEDKKSISDVDKDMEKKASTDSKKSTVAISDEIEEEEIIEEEEEEIEEEEEVEEEEEEEIIEADDLDEDEEPTVESEESEHSEDERHEEMLGQKRKEMEQKRQDAEQKRKEVEQKRKEAEEKKEMEKKKEMEMMELMEEMIKEMEGMQKEMEEMKDELAKQEEIENEKAMERRKELEEKKKERERKAAEDAKEEEYYNWVYAECNRLSLSAAKQQKLVEYQQKQLKVLKNIYSSAKSDLEVLRTKHKQEFDNIGKHLSTLAQHAAGYKKVVDENRKLYNLVQDLKGNIRVYCRSRPFLTTTNKKSCVDCMDDTQVAVITYGKDGKEQRKVYTFNRVFSLVATQAEVYKDTQPLIRSVLDGYNICIFAYGQTGSGKTHTMTGPENLTPELMGVNYRALNDLFDIQQQRKEMITYLVRVQMLEIYNEMVRDLLSPAGATKKLDIRLGAADGINVPDAELIPVSTTEDVIRLMTLGHKNRAVGSTAMNDRSSRSHSCVTVHVSGKDLTSGSTVRGCMHLVDLAGSERADKTEATGDRLKEATHINKSLSALGDVIASLSQKNAHVPYRNSKLTLLLQDALGGQAKTLMFIHVSPDPDTVGETISTLKFAERVSTVELGAAKSNKDIIDLKELKDQVAALKAALGKDAADILNMEDDDDDKSKKAAAAPAAAKAAASAPAKSAPAAAKGKPAAAAAKGKPAAAKKK